MCGYQELSNDPQKLLDQLKELKASILELKSQIKKLGGMGIEPIAIQFNELAEELSIPFNTGK